MSGRAFSRAGCRLGCAIGRRGITDFCWTWYLDDAQPDMFLGRICLTPHANCRLSARHPPRG